MTVLAWLAVACAGAAKGQAPRLEQEQTAKVDAGAAVDSAIARSISRVQAFDNHAHPVLPPPNDKVDREFDALPVDGMEPATDTLAWRLDNSQLDAAWLALWGFHGTAPLSEQQLEKLETARNRVKRREGLHYAEWVLDQAGIGTMLANRVALGAGVAPPRFGWVPYADALLFPLDNRELAEANPDRKLFFPMEDRLRSRYLNAVGLAALPPTLEAYLSKVVTPTLEQQHTGGAIAEKFEVAYLRGFDFSDPTREQAEQAYAKWVHRPKPDQAEYKLLQDYLFRYIARECGRLHMAVHLHAMAGGGAYYDVAGSNPLLLEPVLDDARLRGTRFVLLHGGWPFVREAGALLQKPNVYLDLSQETLTFSPRTLAGWLREWLETYPDKVLFGTDGYPLSAEMGWEEATWIANRNGRQALGLALTGMVKDGQLNRTQAEALAVKVLHGNALALYGAAR